METIGTMEIECKKITDGQKIPARLLLREIAEELYIDYAAVYKDFMTGIKSYGDKVKWEGAKESVVVKVDNRQNMIYDYFALLRSDRDGKYYGIAVGCVDDPKGYIQADLSIFPVTFDFKKYTTRELLRAFTEEIKKEDWGSDSVIISTYDGVLKTVNDEENSTCQGSVKTTLNLLPEVMFEEARYSDLILSCGLPAFEIERLYDPRLAGILARIIACQMGLSKIPMRH